MKFSPLGCRGCSLFLSSPPRPENERSKNFLHPLHPRPSQSLTTPHNLRYSTPMTRWTAAQRTAALTDLQHGATLATVHQDHGIPKQTLSDWARKAGLDLAGRSEAKTAAATKAASAKWAEIRAETANASGRLADTIIDVIGQNPGALVPNTARDVKDLATAAAILIDKAQVLGGDASDRVEHLGLQAAVLDQARESAPHLRAVPA